MREQRLICGLMPFEDSDRLFEVRHGSTIHVLHTDQRPLEDVLAELRGDRAVVSAAVQQDGQALENASDELQGCKD